jgi:two-component system, OmpR family, response regulator RegX3
MTTPSATTTASDAAATTAAETTAARTTVAATAAPAAATAAPAATTAATEAAATAAMGATIPRTTDPRHTAPSYDEWMDVQPRLVLLVEDEEAITAPLTEALEREGFRAETAHSIADGLQAARARRPDLVLLDVMLPDGSGFDLLRELRADGRTPVIMLTARGDEPDRVLGLELGADDYVVKPFSARELVARIRAVLRRTSAVAAPSAPGRLQIGGIDLDAAARTATLDGEPLELTRKEFDLLALLMSQAGTVVSRERLIDEVWDVNWFGSTKTLDVHVSGLRKKLGDDPSDPRYLHTVRGVGFRFAGSVEADAP